MKRIIDKLLDWKNANRRKPLIIRGARQIGKIWTVQLFGRQYYKKVITIDFEKERMFYDFFEKSLDPYLINSEISVPVGRVQFLNMYPHPMTFAKFFMAIDNQSALDIAKKQLIYPKKYIFSFG